MLCKKQSQWAMCMSMWWVVQVFLQALSEAPELRHLQERCKRSEECIYKVGTRKMQ